MSTVLCIDCKKPIMDGSYILLKDGRVCRSCQAIRKQGGAHHEEAHEEALNEEEHYLIQPQYSRIRDHPNSEPGWRG